MAPGLFFATALLASVKQRRKEPHRALLVHEVLRRIFEYAAPPQAVLGKRSVARDRYLLRLSLCCRAFCAPALELLWERLFRLFPVVQLLRARATPSSTWSLRGRSQLQQSTLLSSEHAWSDDDRSRLQKYAKLVRRVSLWAGEELNLSECDRLTALTKGEPLFPGLTEICWTSHWPTHFPGTGCSRLLPLMAVDTLRSVTVHARGSMPTHVCLDLAAFVTALVARAPYLQTVRVSLGNAYSQDPLIPYLLRTESLSEVSLHVPNLPTKVMDVTCGLLRLPALKALSLISEPEHALSAFNAHSSLPGMQGDIELEMSGYTSKMMLFLERVPLRSISSLLLRGLGHVEMEGSLCRWSACAAVYIRRFGQTLRHLQLVERPRNNDAISTAISPWYPLRGLQHFRYASTGPTSLVLREAELITLASAWPSLQYLDLYDLGRVETPCLVTLARLLPYLKMLAVYLDGPGLPMECTLAQSHHLSSMELSVPYRLYDGPSLVLLAQFILRLFPQVTLTLGVDPTRSMTLVNSLPEIVSWIRSEHLAAPSWGTFLEWESWRQNSRR